MLERYQAHLFHYRKRNGEPLAANTRVARLDPLKAFCKWLARTGQIASNPAADLVMPRAPRWLPGRMLTVSEMDRVFLQPDLGMPGGIRDRAILETLYSTRIRRLELVRLKLADVLPEREMLFVRSGKGGRDRWVPLGSRASAWVSRYLVEVRGTLATRRDSTLFLTDHGEPRFTVFQNF